ncbi:inositol monophosphatase 2 [Sitodiplosis mosellana]|uniref:inositol monophosphatase 2 n=1 Tax=Sitodiplosis mosellana TaxID=263140 RepID=UPI002443C586|nr:inositol monophosphatase 2 [Sitodiplosis mosellana]
MGSEAEENLDKCFDVVSAVVRKAGDLIASRFWKSKKVQQKLSDIDLVTETDQEVEKLLIDTLTAEFPHHRFIGEEATSEGAKCELTDAPTWIIDPVDGTMNFVHSFPHSCISIALLVKKQAEIAIIYNPVLKQLFTARRGQGAFYNGKQMHVSDKKEVSQALVVAEFGTSRDEKKLDIMLENFRKILQTSHGVRALGSAALNMAYVAVGGADVNFEFGIHAWDIAAGDLIVREAGGVVIDPAGGPLDLMSRRVLAASSPELASEFSKLIKQYYPEPRD